MQIITSPAQAPRANAICERLIGTLRREVLDRLLVLNQTHLMKVLNEYRSHYNRHRPTSPVHNAHPLSRSIHHPPWAPTVGLAKHPVRRTPILSGLINEYQHAA